MQATNVGDLDNLWWFIIAIGRIHDALRRVKALTPEEYPLKDQADRRDYVSYGHIFICT